MGETAGASRSYGGAYSNVVYTWARRQGQVGPTVVPTLMLCTHGRDGRGK